MSDLPFVGRQEELAKFRGMLDLPDVPWLMWVIGPAGQGKSKFLESCLEECEKQKIHHSGIIDFFNDGLRTRWGLITELAKRFNVENNSELKNAFNQYQSEVIKGELADPDVLQFSLNRSEEALINAIRPKRKSKPHVIFVDTVEEIVENLGLWFFEKFLTKLYPHFRVVAAGRRVPSVGNDLTIWKGQQPYLCELKGLSQENISEYFKSLGLSLDESRVELIYKLTAGHPLSVAWLFQGLLQGTLELDGLSEITPDSLKNQLNYFFEIDSPEKLVLISMAHIYYGIDLEILSWLYTTKQLGVPDFNSLLNTLAGYPYVKYENRQRSLRLHDYFIERVNEEIWSQIDPSCQIRIEISRKMVQYYENKLIGLKEISFIGGPEQDILNHHWLYHLLFADRERAYRELWDVLDTSWHAFKYDYMDSLLDMAQDVNKVLSQIGKFDKVLDALEKSARVWMGLEIFWDTDRAISLANDVLEDSGGVHRFELTAKVAKATALGRLGEFEESVKMLREAYQGYNDLLQVARKAEMGDKPSMNTMLSEHGVATIHGILPERYLILNTIGVLLRNRGHFDEALKEFEQSFELSRAEGDRNWQASAVTQMGTVLRYKGEYALAYDSIGRGIALRKKAGQRGREAFSINALGKLQRDDGHLDKARESFNEALNIWKGLRAEVDMASAMRDLGWIDYEEGKYELAEQHYTQADEIYLRKSLFRELSNLRQKQGALWIGKARVAKSEVERLGCVEKAEILLQEALKTGDKYNQSLYSALSLLDLCRIAEMRGEYERISRWEKRLRKYENEGYHFEPVYADLEEVLGKISEQKALKSKKIDTKLFDDATDHYCQMFVYLARFFPMKYRQRREFLRQWLPSLSDELRQRACKRLIECWHSHSDLAREHPGFIGTVQAMDDL